MALYDTIGRGYTATRRADPRIAARIEAGLGGARSVLNVGAGTGNYEPAERKVVAVEPAATMVAQRPSGAAPAVRAVAEALPFAENAFDAAMTVLSDHHWTDRDRGFAEMRRVAAGPVLVYTWDPANADAFWLTRDYLPSFYTLERERFDLGAVAQRLGNAHIEAVPIPHDCVDGFYHAFWRRPDAYLDPAVRNGISVFARLPAEEVERGMAALAADLASGAWRDRNHALLERSEMDLGYRLIVSER